MNDGHTLTASVPFKRLRASVAACCIFAVAAISSLAAIPAYGQASLPDDVVTKTSLDGSDKAKVEDFVKALKPQLTDGTKLKQARGLLLDKLNVKGVSPSFRLELWKQVNDTVVNMLKSPDPSQVVNGLRIAGEIATDKSAVLILDHLKSAKPSIRFAASFAIMRAFEQALGKVPAMDRATAQQLVGRIADAMKTETDAKCFDSMVRALSAAGADNLQPPLLQTDGLKALGTTTAALLRSTGQKAIDDEMLEAFIRAGTTIRDSFTRQQNAPAWLDEGAQFSDDALSYVYRQLLNKNNAELAPIKAGDAQNIIDQKIEARKTVVQLVSIAESAENLSRQLRSGTQQAPGVSIADLIKRADNTADATALTLIQELLKDKLAR